jgi:hypothetical protein
VSSVSHSSLAAVDACHLLGLSNGLRGPLASIDGGGGRAAHDGEVLK